MRKLIFRAAFAVLCLASCQSGKKGQSVLPNVHEDVGIVLSGLDAEHWTYFSLETGETVGRSAFLDETEDAAWAARTDWDIAICGDYLKTNGGTSGQGLGGILRDMEHNFLTLEEAPSEGYLIDEVGIVK